MVNAQDSPLTRKHLLNPILRNYHGAHETEKAYTLDREQFYELLKNASIRSKASETILNNNQLKQATEVLSSIKRKRKLKSN